MALVAAGPLALVQLGIVLLVCIGALALVRRKVRPPAGVPLRSTQLTHHHAVHVIDVGGRLLLVGTGPAGAPRLLTELDRASKTELLGSGG